MKSVDNGIVGHQDPRMSLEALAQGTSAKCAETTPVVLEGTPHKLKTKLQSSLLLTLRLPIDGEPGRCKQEVADSIMAAECTKWTVETAEPNETDTDVNRTPMLGRELATRDCGVDEGDVTERKDLRLLKAEFYCKEIVQRNKNENENIPSTQKLPLEGEWTACASGEMTDLERDADMSNELTEPLTMTIEPDNADGGGVPSVYLGGMWMWPGDVNGSGIQMDGPGCQMDVLSSQADVLRGQTDTPIMSNGAEMVRMSCGDEAGTYLGIRDTKLIILEMVGIRDHADASTGQVDAPSVETDADTPVNELQIVRGPQNVLKTQNSPYMPETE